jgi:long-chain fatty acid transport protein
MKKILTLFLVSSLTATLFAGGLVTNNNQSALFTRLQSRNGSTAIDAVYYNPAGLTKLSAGFHFSVSNQTIKQTRTITTDYPYLHNGTFDGTVNAPVFPSIYAAFNYKKFAFSFGFNPVGGGGGATFKKGLPLMEISASDLVPALSARGVNDYRLNEYFEGKSIFFGYQAGVSYEINSMISVYAGLRYVTAKNSYSGYLKDIEVYNYGGGATWTRADVIMGGIAASAGTAATSTGNIVTAGYGSLTLAQCVSNGILTQGQSDALAAGLTAFGAPTTVNITTANAVFNTAYAKYTGTARLLGDQEADVVQTGSGIAPILGVNISLSDKLNIGLKYEFKTKLEVVNDTKSDFLTGYTETGADITMFPDKAKTINDMPAMLSAGFEFKPIKKILLTGSANYYFDKSVDYDGSADVDINEIDKNFTEFALGVQYGFSKLVCASVGWQGTFTGVNDNFQSQLRYSANTNTFGGGIGLSITPMIDINLAASYTLYDTVKKTYEHDLAGSGTMVTVNETYDKTAMIIAVGVDLHF